MWNFSKIKKLDLVICFPLFLIGFFFFYKCCTWYIQGKQFADEFEKSIGFQNEKHASGVIAETLSPFYNPFTGFIGLLLFSGLPTLIFLNYLKQQREEKLKNNL